MCIVFMPYPPESQIRLPLLKSAKDKKIHSVLVVEKYLGDYFKLNSSEKKQFKQSINAVKNLTKLADKLLKKNK